MLYHMGLNTLLGQFTGQRDAPWDVCVDFFFFLSGFVLCRSVQMNRHSAGAFAWKRAWRLLPVHLAILVLFAPVLYSTGFDPTQVVGDVSGLLALAGIDMSNGPAWSVAFEFYLPVAFVVAFRAGAGFVRRPRLALGMMLLVASGCTYALALGIRLDWLRASAGLGGGYLLYQLLTHWGHFAKPRHASWAFPAVAITFLAIVILTSLQPLIAIVFPLLFVVALYVGSRSTSLFSSAPLRLLGRLSYTIYLVHVPVLKAFVVYFGARLDGSVPLKATAVVCCLVAAYCLHLAVERPAMTLGSRLARSFKSPTSMTPVGTKDPF